MKKLILYNPGIATADTGDEIVYESCLKVMKEIFPDAFRIQFSSHTPVPFLFNWRYFMKADYKFACGTNIMDSYMLKPIRQWDVTWLNAWHVGPVVLLGVGWRQYMGDPDLYTRVLYKMLLSGKYLHSVRDSYAEEKLKKLGIKNVINTSCPTMWELTDKHCSKIPRNKADTVVCTLTDYKKDYEKDKRFIRILQENYKHVYFWVQGMRDLDYLVDELDIKKGVDVIPPGLENFDQILTSDMEIDYVGTRLHGGIRALQKGRRSLIIGLDNRAMEKKKDFNLNVIHRDNIEDVPGILHQPIETHILTPTENIERWKKQFK